MWCAAAQRQLQKPCSRRLALLHTCLRGSCDPFTDTRGSLSDDAASSIGPTCCWSSACSASIVQPCHGQLPGIIYAGTAVQPDSGSSSSSFSSSLVGMACLAAQCDSNVTFVSQCDSNVTQVAPVKPATVKPGCGVCAADELVSSMGGSQGSFWHLQGEQDLGPMPQPVSQQHLGLAQL